MKQGNGSSKYAFSIFLTDIEIFIDIQKSNNEIRSKHPDEVKEQIQEFFIIRCYHRKEGRIQRLSTAGERGKKFYAIISSFLPKSDPPLV